MYVAVQPLQSELEWIIVIDAERREGDQTADES